MVACGGKTDGVAVSCEKDVDDDDMQAMEYIMKREAKDRFKRPAVGMGRCKH